MQKVINSLIGVLMLAAFVATMMLPVGEEPQPLVHYEQIHVLEPWETVGDVAEKYFKEQQEYESLQQFVCAIKMANGMDHVYQAGDRLIIPMSYVKK